MESVRHYSIAESSMASLIPRPRIPTLLFENKCVGNNKSCEGLSLLTEPFKGIVLNLERI